MISRIQINGISRHSKIEQIHPLLASRKLRVVSREWWVSKDKLLFEQMILHSLEVEDYQSSLVCLIEASISFWLQLCEKYVMSFSRATQPIDKWSWLDKKLKMVGCKQDLEVSIIGVESSINSMLM